MGHSHPTIDFLSTLNVCQKPASKIDEIPSLSTTTYSILRSKFKVMTSSLTSAAKSKDSLTTKLLIRLQELVWLLDHLLFASGLLHKKPLRTTSGLEIFCESSHTLPPPFLTQSRRFPSAGGEIPAIRS
ncbi:hypothetical protein KFK09_018914 [Dendrobium nobile]|uniref:Uncharacterized protein n=1 Tax=Dendrobium nobile TaxID=94219 RepID=A0A8T3AXI5_DENNO|nr:hypothetical protein KFK09_018914 [Dendrobium nobile]